MAGPSAKRPRLPLGSQGGDAEADAWTCPHYKRGYCYYGDSCWYEHRDPPSEGRGQWSDDEAGAWSSPSEEPPWLCKVPRAQRAGLRIVVKGPRVVTAAGLPAERVSTGPMRLRVAGDVAALGCYNSNWDPQYGMDLVW